MKKNFKRVLFFTYWPFNQRDRVRFDLTPFKEYGIQFEYWDVSAVTDPEYAAVYSKSGTSFPENYRVFSNNNEVQSEIKKLNADTLICSLIPNKKKYSWIYNAITKSPAEYFLMNTTAIPASNYKTPIFERFRKAFRNPSRFLKKLDRTNHKNNDKLEIKPALFLVAGGIKSASSTFQGRVIWAHSPDYEQFLADFKVTPSSPKHIVFLDEYNPFHPDFLMLEGSRQLCTADNYYPLLCKFFKTIENKFKLPVVIAAHPSSAYETTQDYFEGRKVIKGKTSELVRDSVLVILHASTAVAFANLFEKPMLFVATEEMKKNSSFYMWNMKSICNFHNAPFLMLREKDAPVLPSEFKIDQKAYENYREEYIKRKESPSGKTWDIVAEYVSKL